MFKIETETLVAEVIEGDIYFEDKLSGKSFFIDAAGGEFSTVAIPEQQKQAIDIASAQFEVDLMNHSRKLIEVLTRLAVA